MDVIARGERRIGFVGGPHDEHIPARLIVRSHATKGQQEHVYVPAVDLEGAVERIKGLRERVNDDDPDRREREYARGYRAAVADALEVLVRGR